MKNNYRIVAFILLFMSIFPKAFSQYNYIIDSTSFSSLTLDGGDVGMCLSDINRDGHVDLLSIGDHGSPFINTNQHGITVWFGSGVYNNWSLFQNGDFGYGGIKAGDINNDGLPDVAYGMHHNYSTSDFGDQLLEAALGDGTGMNWTPWDDSLATAGETYGMFDTDLGDMDNDGWLDIGSTSFGCCAGFHVYKNMGTGLWQHAYGYVGGNASEEFLFGDMNGDGNLDFATTHQNGTPYFGNGAGGFMPAHYNLPVQANLGYAHISLGDVDGDGGDELCFAMNDGIFVYKFDTALNQWANMSGILPTAGYYSGAKLADMNNDGFLDVVGVQDDSVMIWEGDGGISWNLASVVVVPNMYNTRDVAIGDVTHDGRPELFLWSQYPLSWFTYETKLCMLHDTTIADQFYIQGKRPTANECYPAGSIRFIKWNSAIPSNHPSSVTLEYSYSGTNGPWNSIAAGIPDNGSYQWTVPFITSNDCYIRYIITDSITTLTDTAVSTNAFSIGCGIDTRVSSSYHNDFIVDLFPNPSQKTVYCSVLTSSTTVFSIHLLNLTGEVIAVPQKKFSGNSIFEINISSVPAGIYFVEIRSADYFTVKKLIVE